jgi:hypothetical protein
MADLCQMCIQSTVCVHCVYDPYSMSVWEEGAAAIFKACPIQES